VLNFTIFSILLSISFNYTKRWWGRYNFRQFKSSILEKWTKFRFGSFFPPGTVTNICRSKNFETLGASPGSITASMISTRPLSVIALWQFRRILIESSSFQSWIICLTQVWQFEKGCCCLSMSYECKKESWHYIWLSCRFYFVQFMIRVWLLLVGINPQL
jgi:hypothetical protein